MSHQNIIFQIALHLRNRRIKSIIEQIRISIKAVR